MVFPGFRYVAVLLPESFVPGFWDLPLRLPSQGLSCDYKNFLPIIKRCQEESERLHGSGPDYTDGGAKNQENPSNPFLNLRNHPEALLPQVSLFDFTIPGQLFCVPLQYDVTCLQHIATVGIFQGNSRVLLHE